MSYQNYAVIAPDVTLPCQNATCRTGKPALHNVEGVWTSPTGGKVPLSLKICEDCFAPILAGQRAVSMSHRPTT